MHPLQVDAMPKNRFASVARTVALAMIIAITILNVIWAIRDWHLHDMDVYWNAGQMWRHGGNPYLLTANADASSVYRYAPWFAALWVPLTFLPGIVVNVPWSGLLVAPMLLFERPSLASEFGGSNSLSTIAPELWIASSAVALVATLWVVFRRLEWAWPTIGAASNIILPRVFLYDITLLLPGLAETVARARNRGSATAGDR